MLDIDVASRPRVVIIGAGFGGLSAAKTLARAPVDRRNYHLFQPLLYQVATGGLSPADIAAPVPGILRHQENATVMLASVTRVDTARREVLSGISAARTRSTDVKPPSTSFTSQLMVVNFASLLRGTIFRPVRLTPSMR